MSDNSGLVIVGAMFFGVLFGYGLGNSFGKDDGFDAAIELYDYCEKNWEIEDHTSLKQCVTDIVDAAREERYIEAAAEQYP